MFWRGWRVVGGLALGLLATLTCLGGEGPVDHAFWLAPAHTDENRWTSYDEERLLGQGSPSFDTATTGRAAGFGSEYLIPLDADETRHVGWGRPLQGTSWRNRPVYIGWHVGGIWGDTLITDRLDQEEDLFGGYYLGWDFDHFWGVEARFSFTHLDLIDAGEPVSTRTNRSHFYDASLLYYPWGDAAWRPYLGVGVGLAHLRFVDDLDLGYADALLEFPLSIGCKYYFQNWLALKLTLTDNLVIGDSGLNTMHQWSLTGGVEVRFGGPPVSYFPWNNNIHSW